MVRMQEGDVKLLSRIMSDIALFWAVVTTARKNVIADN